MLAFLNARSNSMPVSADISLRSSKYDFMQLICSTTLIKSTVAAGYSSGMLWMRGVQTFCGLYWSNALPNCATV